MNCPAAARKRRPTMHNAPKPNSASPSFEERDASGPTVASIAGSIVRFAGGSPDIHRRLDALLDPFLLQARDAAPVDIAIVLEPAPAQGGWRVYINDAFVTMAYDSNYLLPYLEWLAISRAVERATESVAFHAASLAWQGRAVILVAASGAGKTTLTSGLAGRGWEPLADDLTVVDLERRMARPFPRCFHADAFTRAVIGDAIHAITPDPSLPDYIRPARWAANASEPAWVVMVRRDAETPSSIQSITRAQAAGALFTSAIRNSLPRSRVARLSADLASTISGCWEINNSDLTSTLDLLETALLRS